MAIDDTLNAGINLNIQAGGGGSVQDMSARLRNMKDALAVTKKELQEAGVNGSVFMKATQDASLAVSNANAQMKEYSASVKKFGPDSTAAANALKGMKSALSDVATETAALNAKVVNVSASSDSWWKNIGTTGVSSLAKWTAGIFSVYAAFNYLKGAIGSAMDYNEKVDKLAVSGNRVGLSFQEASDAVMNLAAATSKTAGYDAQGVGGNQSTFDQSQIIEGLTKLRDRGVDVFHMTQDQLKPVLDTAVATVQDLGEVSDATGVAMQQFGLDVSDTTALADLMVGAFQEAGLTAAEFRDGISSAGTAAKASGTSIQEYTAVLARLKQLNMDGGQFQKLFFSALNAPSAKQLLALDRMGVRTLRRPDELGRAGSLKATSGIGAVGDFATSHGFGGVGDSINRLRLGAAQTLESVSAPMKDQAAAVEEARQKLVELAKEQENLSGQEATFTNLVSIQKEKIDALKESQNDWKDKLASTTAALSDVKTKFDQLADPKISGMSAFDAKISQAEIALKRQQLALLQNANGTQFYETRIKSLTGEMKDQEKALDGMRRRYDEVGKSLEKAKTKAGDYEAKLASLRNTELAGEGAFSDTQFAIQQQINQLQLKKTQLSPVDLFGANQIDAQIAAAQKQLEQSRLTQSVTFDPQHRAVDKAGEAADIATGKKQAPGTATDIISQIDDYAAKLERENERVKKLTKEHDREAKAIANKTEAISGMKSSIDEAKDAMDALSESTKAAENALNELKLEKEVEFGEKVFVLKEKYRAWREELGLIAKEKPYEEQMREMDTLGTKYGELQKTREIEQGKVDAYQKKIDEGSLSLSFYERRLDGVKGANERLGKTVAALEEQYAGMPKVYLSEMEILDQLSGRVLNVGAAYDYLGKRGAGALVALVGANGENVEKLQALAGALGSNGNAASSASAASASVLDAAFALQAAFRNLTLDIGTKVGESMGGLVGALTKLTNVIISWIGPTDDNWGNTAAALKKGTADMVGVKTDFSRDAWNHLSKSAQDYWVKEHGRQPITYAMGGLVPGYGYQDTVPAMLTPGERVLTKQENRSYENGMGGVTVNITGPVSIRSDQDIKNLARAISKELNSEVRRVRSGQPA